MNLVGMVILAVILLFGFAGMRQGLVRKFSTVLALVLSSVLVGLILPYTTQLMKERTPVYDFLTEQGKKLVSTKLVEKAVIDAAGEGIPDLQLPQLPEEAGGLFAAQGLDPEMLGVLDRLSKVEQTRLIKAMPLPSFVQRIMINFNNNDGYRTLNAGGFADYLVRFVVNILVNILAFFVTMLITWLIVRGIISALDLCARMPFLYTVNRIGGLAAGLIEGVFFVWLMFLVISMFSGTQAGAWLIGEIHKNTALAPIYEGNIFLRTVTGAIAHIM